MTALNAFKSTLSKDDSDVSKWELERELRYRILASLARCELEIMHRVKPPLSIDERSKHYENAKHYAIQACKQKHGNRENCTCEILRLVKREQQGIH
jgi:hypothetical protein